MNVSLFFVPSQYLTYIPCSMLTGNGMNQLLNKHNFKKLQSSQVLGKIQKCKLHKGLTITIMKSPALRMAFGIYSAIIVLKNTAL